MSNIISLASGFEVWAIRGYHGCFHLLHDRERGEAVLIDAGLVGEMPALGRILNGAGLEWSAIKAILLTHGHLDHTGNLAWIKAKTGATIFAHPAEQPHIDGTFPYRGASRICGAMEAVGRTFFRYRPVPIDKPLAPDAKLPFWGGLRVIHLPGHTDGHCGFYSERFNLLFTGDLFASYGFSTHLPPLFLNSAPEQLPQSFRRVSELSPRLIIPNHYDGKLDGERFAGKFRELAARINSSP
jgi:glyoxylase-like metal-dependent hydrolase (beta-lactamase superfamily II)